MTDHLVVGSLPSWRDGPAKQSILTFRDITNGPEKNVLRGLGALFAGWTVIEYDEQAREFLSRAVHPRFDHLHPRLTYHPMLELVTAGGRLGIADPDHSVGFGYVCSRMRDIGLGRTFLTGQTLDRRVMVTWKLPASGGSMRAVWYDEQGPARVVLRVGEVPALEPGPSEVRVRVRLSGVNPGDTKKRRGWLGSRMPFPRVIPHSDGAGIVEAVGEGVDPGRVGRRVWVYGAQSYRPFGTSAQLTVVPEHQAVELPDDVSDEVGACLGIPGITAHRAVFADGPVAGMTVLVHGVLGGVSALAAQLAHWAGATVIGTVRREHDLGSVNRSALAHAVALDGRDPVAAIRAVAPEGVDRVVEVAFSDNVDLDAAVVKNQAVIATFATRRDRPDFPFWPMLFDNVVIRLLGSDDFPVETKRQAARDLTTAAHEGALSIAIGDPLPLERAAEAHDRVEAGGRERVLLAIPD